MKTCDLVTVLCKDLSGYVIYQCIDMYRGPRAHTHTNVLLSALYSSWCNLILHLKARVTLLMLEPYTVYRPQSWL